MFGSTTPLGQSSSSPFGSQSIFGQTNSTTGNPFAPKPFGSITPFGSQTGASIFGNTSTGVFGAAQSSSPFSSSPVFGASSSTGFGSATPSFGASSTPAFGSSSSSSFSGSSTFGQKSVFGSFGTQTSPFGGTFQQSQPSFGSSAFGSTSPFGASSQPSFGVSSSSAFGSTNAAGFGASSASPFGSTGAGFGMPSTPVFGSSGAFGASTTPAFGQSSTSPFGSSATVNFSATSAPAYSVSSTPGFGSSATPTFGVSGTSSTPTFGAAATPSFSFGSSPGFGQTAAGFGSTASGSTFGTQPVTPTFGSSLFGQSTFAGARSGSRIAPYNSTADPDSGTSGQPPGKLESISAMPAYKDKSHEELRWEDYQQGDKGGPNPAAQSTGFSFPSGVQSNPFASSSSVFGQSSSNPFSTNTSSNLFSPKPPMFGSQGTSTAAFSSSPFSTTSISNPFGTATGTTSLFATSSPGFGSSPSTSLFSAPSSSGFGLPPSPFGSATAQAATPAFSFNTQSSPLFQSSSPSLALTSNLAQTASTMVQNPAPFSQPSIFSSSSSSLGGSLFGNNPSLLSTSSTFGFPQATSTLFQAPQPAPTSSTFSFPSFGQSAGAGGFGIGSSNFGQNLGQLSSSQTSLSVHPVTISNPFGTLPAMPQMSISHAGTSSSVQYGISSMPAVDKPAPIRISSLLTTRHLSQRRIKLPARKYHRENDGLKVPFFKDGDEGPSTPKADAFFIPRENPRALIIRPVDQWSSKGKFDKTPPLNSTPVPVHGNGSSKDESRPSNGCMTTDADLNKDKDEETEQDKSVGPSHNGGGIQDAVENQKVDSYISLNGHRAGEAAIVYEHGADIEAMMPKLRHSDYYTEPRIQELAAKERASPGFCKHVKNFVIGRHGFGSIRFLGETDVRRLDLESLIQFNHREVIVYMDDSRKPPVGQGLNKAAEVTLLNIKCHDKKTGRQYTEGPKVEKYVEMLKKKAEDQGAEFLSYDAVTGEWRFRVEHFSKYSLGDEDGWGMDCDDAFE